MKYYLVVAGIHPHICVIPVSLIPHPHEDGDPGIKQKWAIKNEP
jgi:hypothetical protein